MSQFFVYFLELFLSLFVIKTRSSQVELAKSKIIVEQSELLLDFDSCIVWIFMSRHRTLKHTTSKNNEAIIFLMIKCTTHIIAKTLCNLLERAFLCYQSIEKISKTKSRQRVLIFVVTYIFLLANYRCLYSGGVSLKRTPLERNTVRIPSENYILLMQKQLFTVRITTCPL